MTVMCLSDLGQVITGNTPSKSIDDFYDSEDICFVKPSDFYSNSLSKIDKTENYLSEKARCVSRIVPKGSILVTCIGIIGKVAVLNGDAAFNQQINAIIPDKKKVLPMYLAYSLLSKQQELAWQANAAVVPIINKSQFSKLQLDIPDIDSQNKIISVLSKVDTLTTRFKKQLEDLDLLIKSRFIEMFGLLLTQEKAVTLENLISQNIITYHLDGNHGGLYPKADEFVRTGVPYLGANAIIDGRIDFKKAKFLTERKASILRKGIAQNGDVLFAHNATVGPVAILKTDYKKVIVSTSLTVYRCNNRRILPVFIKYFMESEFFVNQYKKDMKQTTRNQVPITHQKKFMFIVPPIELQNQFADFVAQVDKSKLAVQQSLNELETLKKSLMQQYFG